MGTAAPYDIRKLLAGIQSRQQEWEDSWNSGLLHRFQDHVDQEQHTLRTALENLAYTLDAPNTVAMVLGIGRPEKVRSLFVHIGRRCLRIAQRLLPLIYLLLSRSLQVMKFGCKAELCRNALSLLADSINMLFLVVRARLDSLQRPWF